MWRTNASPVTPPVAAASLRRPISLIARTNAALRAFAASRLFSSMSQRCTVTLQGMPDSRLAISASVELVAPQCA